MEQAISSDLIRGHIDTIILHTLLDGDKYAQQISDTVELKSEKKYQLNQATLYSSLKRLETSGYVKSYWFDADDGRRKFIKITEKGKNFVNLNLSNWSFSRAIIDKLMDVEPEKVVPIIVQPTASKPVETETITPARTNAFPPITDFNKNNAAVTQSKTDEIKYTPVINNARNINTTTVPVSEEKEINFRNILNGLIKATAIQNNKEKQNLQELETEKNVQDESVKVMKFNETLDTEYDAKSRSGKIDFGDLAIKAQKEGYKLRVSSKSSARPNGNIYENKLTFYSVIAVCIVAVVEYLFFILGSAKNMFSTTTFILAASAIVALPIIFGVIYYKNPRKTTKKAISGDRILTCSIIVFNLLLITFAVNFLFNVDFSDGTAMLKYLIAPCIIFANAFVYFVIEFCFSKSEFFKVKKK